MRAADLGYAPRFFEFSRGFELFTVSVARPPSHPKRLTLAVRRLK